MSTSAIEVGIRKQVEREIAAEIDVRIKQIEALVDLQRKADPEDTEGFIAVMGDIALNLTKVRACVADSDYPRLPKDPAQGMDETDDYDAAFAGRAGM